MAYDIFTKAAAVATCRHREATMKPIDLTLTISKTLPTFPGSPRPQFIEWSALDEDGYNLELLLASTHSGTHLDAPYHFARDGLRVDQIRPERLVGRAVLIRIAGGAIAARSRRRAITRDDIRKFEESVDGRAIRPGTPVIFYTGWQEGHLGSKDYFLANPGIDRSAARYLASKRVGLVGTDSPSIDVGGDPEFPAHRVLAEAGVVIVENLANLGKIRSSEFDFVILPLKLRGASGSPVRALALSR